MNKKINIAVIIETELWNGGNFQVELNSALKFKNSEELSNFNFFFFRQIRIIYQFYQIIK